MTIRTIDNIPPNNVVFKMNNQCVETDNIALYRRADDGYIRNEYYKINEPLHYLPDLVDPFNHIQLFRQGNRCPFRKYPQVMMDVHESVMSRRTGTAFDSATGFSFQQYTVNSFTTEPFNFADVMMLWAASNHDANVNYTEFPTPRCITHFVVFTRASAPSQDMRLFTLNPDTNLRERILYENISRCKLLGCNGELSMYRVLKPISVTNLFLEYKDISFFQAYQTKFSSFSDLLYFEDYPDKQLPNEVALLTKRTINTECTRNISVFGTPKSGVFISLIPLFDSMYEPTGYAIINNYVKNGELQSYARTQSIPTRLRFTCTLENVLNIAAMEFIMAVPALPEDMSQPAFNACIYPQVILVEGRLKETDAWYVLDEIQLDLMGDVFTKTEYGYRPDGSYGYYDVKYNQPYQFTCFHYLTYRRPVKEVRFTVQAFTNYTPLVANLYSIVKTHFYFPQVRCFEHVT